ncbi:PAS domain S-box protein [Thermodesulfobacteriota bacterium]
MTDKPSYEEQEQRIKELEKEALEQKLAMEKIKESEERFRLVFEKSNDVMLVHKFGEIKDVNRMACEVTGYSRKQLLAMSVLDLFPEDYQSEIKSRLKKNVQKGATSFETKWKRSDGKLIDVEVSSSAFNPKDETRVGITRDITERKQAEEALKESEERYRMMFEHAGFAITIVNAETGERVAFNKVAHESLGYTYAEYRDLQTANQNVSETTNEVKEHFREIIEKGSDVFETQHRTKDGEIRDMLMSAVPILIGGEIFIQSIRIDITDRKQAEEILSYFKSAVESSSDAIGVSSPEGKHWYQNKIFHDLFGDIGNDPPGSVYVDEKVGREVFKTIMEGGQWTGEVEMYGKDKNVLNIFLRAYAIKDNGKVRGLVGVHTDITERKQTEEDLRESENFNVSLLDNSPTSILVVNPDTSIKYINPMLEKLTGYSSEELIGQRVPYPWWIEDDPRSGYSAEKKEMMFKANRQFQKIFRKRNGEEFWVEINTVAIMQNEELKYAMSIWVDITYRKQAEEALRESEEHFRELSEMLPEAVFETDMAMKLTFVNQQAYTMFGYTKQDFEKGLTAHEMLVPEDRKRASQNIKKRFQSEKFGLTEYQGLKKDGSVFPILFHSSPIIYKGTAIGLRGIIMDITERKKLEVQLQQAQKMEAIGTLAGGIAHDFNNILSPIMMYSEMAIMDLPADNPIQHNLKGIYSAGERARDLVNQILTYSRKGEVKQIAIKITPIIKDVLKMLRSSIPTTIDIQQNLEAESDTVLADPTQINQIMLNLGTNAAHAMREKGGILEVSLEQEDLDSETTAQYTDLTGSYLKLTVSDNGTGIDNETIQKIFEPYFTTKEVGEGTGMGLSLVHGIVKSYGGDIIVESELGKGTTFEVYLPRIEKEVASVAEPSVQLPKGSERVLFADDENVSVDVMKAMLENLGYQVTARTSSIEALEAFRHNPEGFDLVITDMTMPNMTGKELAKEIMSIRSDLPIILCTGFSEQIDESRAKEMGISAYLMKPIIIRDMANTIREVLDKK